MALNESNPVVRDTLSKIDDLVFEELEAVKRAQAYEANAQNQRDVAAITVETRREYEEAAAALGVDAELLAIRRAGVEERWNRVNNRESVENPRKKLQATP